MREGWTYKKLGEVISPAKVIKNGNNNNLPILSITMRDGIVTQNSRFKKVIASVDTSTYKVVKNGQLVIAFPIDEGLIYTQDIVEAGIMSPAYNVWDVDFSNLNRRFLITYLHSPYAMKYYKSKLRGTTMRRRSIPKEDLLNMPLPCPLLSEQHSIVAELDKINELISLKKAQLSDLDSLAQSIFYDMFGDPIENGKGWEVKKLGEVTEPTIGLTYKPDNVTSDGTGTIVLRSSNIQDSKLDFEDVVRVNMLIKDNKYVKDGDILMCSRNGSFRLVGKVAMIHALSERMSYGAFMTIIRSEYNPYLFGYFKTSAFREYLIQGKTTTVNQITVQMLKEIKLPIPPLSLQQEFAKRIELI